MTGIISLLENTLKDMEKATVKAYAEYEGTGNEEAKLKADMFSARAHGYRMALNDVKANLDSEMEEMARSYGQE